MKSVNLYLLSSILLLISMATSCPKDEPPGCYDVHTTYYPKDSVIFTRVVNFESGRVVLERFSMPNAGDTLHFSLPLNPEKAQSSFEFRWPNKAPDTLVVKHNYQEALDFREDYYFELVSIEVGQNSFGDRFIINSSERCVEAELNLR